MAIMTRWQPVPRRITWPVFFPHHHHVSKYTKSECRPLWGLDHLHFELEKANLIVKQPSRICLPLRMCGERFVALLRLLTDVDLRPGTTSDDRFSVGGHLRR